MVLSDGEEGMLIPVSPKVEAFSPTNPDYDFDYLEFLSEIEADAQSFLPCVSPAPPEIKEASERDFPIRVPSIPTLPWTEQLSPTSSSAVILREDPKPNEATPPCL